MPRPESFARRYVGGYVPLELFEAFEAARGDRGVGSRTEALAQAIALWVVENPPTRGLPRVIADAARLVQESRAARSALDAAIAEWRLSRREELLTKIIELAATAGLEVPLDISAAIGVGKNDDSP